MRPEIGAGTFFFYFYFLHLSQEYVGGIFEFFFHYTNPPPAACCPLKLARGASCTLQVCVVLCDAAA